jgi:WD40 repeat protein
MIHKLKIHKVIVKSLSFSYNEKFLASAGGIDDKNMLIIWELATGKAVYGSSLGTAEVSQISFFNRNEEKLIATTAATIQILTIDVVNKKIVPIECNMGNIKRNYTSLMIEPSDTYAYCGTKTGDIIEVGLTKG